MTMDRVLSNGGVPPVCSATSPSTASPGCGGGGRKLSLPGGAPSDEEDADDPEVMQVVSSGGGRPLNLRLKREPRGEERERPMSWEGELSGAESPSTPGSPMCIAGDKEQALDYQLNQTEDHACSTNGQQNCASKVSSGAALVVAFPAAPSPLRPPSGPFAPSPSAAPGVSGHHSPYLGGDRPSSGRSITFEPTSQTAGTGNCNLLRGSPAQGHHPVVSYLPGAGGYSQSPSPVLNRPTSSCSSRSSYSPTQSPLLGRGPHYGAPAANAHSPVLSRHGGGTSSDGSVYSPTNSPLQGRHVSSVEAGSVLYSPAESPSQGRHPILPDSSAAFPSPSQSPAHLRHLGPLSGGSPRPPVGPFNISLSPSPLTPVNATVTPDQVGSTSEALQLHLHGTHQNYVDHLTTTSSLDGTRGNLHHGIPPESSSASVASSASDESNASDFSSPTRRLSVDNTSEDGRSSSGGGGFCGLSELTSPSGSGTLGGNGGSISRQQLLSGPCPICGDRISGFHYGIFSCESCKGFFKRTVQNKKNYVCLRGAKCTIAISTRKKCPACRFDKCLKTGMKLEAIREDRTRGGRSTYQCSYTLASQSLCEGRDPYSLGDLCHMDGSPNRVPRECGGMHSGEDDLLVPPLMQEILSVEHLWHYTDREMGRLAESRQPSNQALSPDQQQQQQQQQLHPLLSQTDKDQNFLNNLCNIADHRLYKIVKWCKSLPLFRDIEIDDQIALLINSWCELLLLSCCYRSMASPQQEILVSHGKSVSLGQAKAMGLGPVIERMLNLTEHLRRLQVDQYEYVCLKVIILLTSDVSGLKESTKVGICQKQVLEALQTYTRTHYPQQPSKFGELLLRIPELERACQVGKESLASKQRAGEVPSFNLLMELLRGDH